MEDNRRPEPDEIRRASGAGANAGDSHGATDTTQTFGHDSDLSFVPFGSDLSDAELDAIEALPTRCGAVHRPLRPDRRCAVPARHRRDHRGAASRSRHLLRRRHRLAPSRRDHPHRAPPSNSSTSARSTAPTSTASASTARVLTNGSEVRVGKFRLNFFVSPADLPQAADG